MANFGSGTCQSINCLKVAQELRLDEKLAALGVKVQEFKPLLLKGQPSTSISANVEQEVLAQTDFLVTIGYGSFQRGVVERFVKSHSLALGETQANERVLRICS